MVHTDLRRTGWFDCGDERINRLHEAAVWSMRGNVCDIPTDCPTRERAGWTGDWQVFAPTAAFLYDVAGFSAKWLRDVAADQWPDGTVSNISPACRTEGPNGPVAHLNGSAGWGDAAIIVPWQMYRAYGDRAVLEELWPTMTAWLGRTERVAREARHPDRVLRSAEPAPHERYLWDTGFHWGEWLVPGEHIGDDLPQYAQRDKADIATAYYAHSTRLAARIARVIGRDEEAAAYEELSERIREAWRTEFITPDGSLRPDTQANHVRALAFDLVPKELRARTAERLAELVRDSRHASGHRLPRDPGPAPCACRHRAPRRGVRAAAPGQRTVLAAHDRPRRDHDLGELGGCGRRRHTTRLPQPLLQGRCRLLPASLHRRNRAGRGLPGLSAIHRGTAPGRRPCLGTS